MAITEEDINLQKFLEKFTPAAFPETGKLTLTNFEFLQIASLLKIDFDLKRLLTKWPKHFAIQEMLN